MLPSALPTASAPAITHFRGSIAHPTRLLCTLRRRCRHRRRNTHYQAGATPYLGRTCTGWIAPASPGAPEVGLVASGQIGTPCLLAPSTMCDRAAIADLPLAKDSHVSQHQDAAQLYGARNLRVAIRPQVERFYPAFAGQRARLRADRGAGRQSGKRASRHARDDAPPRNREIESAKARARAANRFQSDGGRAA